MSTRARSTRSGGSASPAGDAVPRLPPIVPQIRNRGTLGGNVGTASPAGDALPPLLAERAEVELASVRGVRTLPLEEFLLGVKRTALAPDELVTAVHLTPCGGPQTFMKVGVRNAMVIATASACLAVDRPSRSVRLALGSVGPTILRCPEAESFAAGAVEWSDGTVDEATVEHFGELAAATARPIDDHRSTAAYRRHAIGVLARRLLRRAFP